MGRRSFNSIFVLSLVSLSTTAALWQESRNCLTFCADHITCCEEIPPQSNTQDEHTPPILYASEDQYAEQSKDNKQNPNSENSVFIPQHSLQNGAVTALEQDDNEIRESKRPKRSMDSEPDKENEQIYNYYKVAKRSLPHAFGRSKDADMMMRLGKRSISNFNHLSDLNKRQTASMMRMGKRSIPDNENQNSAERIYRLLLNKRQTASMMRMGKRSAFNGDMMRMGKRDPIYDDERFGKRGYSSSLNGDMMRMGKRDFAFNDDMRFGKRDYSSFNGDMMRMGKRYLEENDVRFGKRASSFNGDMMRMGKRDFSSFNDDMRFGKRDSSFNGDMMRMGKRSAFNDDLRFGKRDPWVSMEDEYSLMPKRSSNIWKKNQDADLMRIGKRSAFNDDMMRMGKRFSMEDDMRFGK